MASRRFPRTIRTFFLVILLFLVGSKSAFSVEHLTNGTFSSAGGGWSGATGGASCTSGVPSLGSWTANALTFSYVQKSVTQSVTISTPRSITFSVTANRGWNAGGTYTVTLSDSNESVNFSTATGAGSGTYSLTVTTSTNNEIVTVTFAGRDSVNWAGCYGPQFTSASLTSVADTTPPTITGPGSATGSTSSTSIPENTTSVYTFNANETVTWSISGTDSSFFSISSGGVLTITSRNYESPADSNADNVYVVIVTATDTSSNATNQTLSLTITNVNEAPSIINNASAATYSLSQAENNQSLFTYTATDPDAGTSLTWSLSGTDAGDFTIGSGSGVFAFAANPDYEAPADSNADNVYTVVVTVSDGSLTDTQTVTISVTNVNESSSTGSVTTSGTVYKGVFTTITVSSNVAGKVRFFVDGKRISTCLSVTNVGSYPNYTATCSWKPAVKGRHILSATITPTDNTFSSATSYSNAIYVQKRSTSR